jgi:hypothetical protein
MIDFGLDMPGCAYSTKVLSMAKRIGLFIAAGTDDPKFEHAKVFTAWGLSTWLT